MRFSIRHLAQRSLRARLLAATAVLVTLALGAAAVGFERSARKVILAAIGDHLAARAREALDATRRFQDERCTAVRNWAEADAMQGTLDTGDPKFAEDYLRRTIQDQGGGISVAALLDGPGRIRAAVRYVDGGKRRGEALERLRQRMVVGLAPATLALQGQALAVAIAPRNALDPSDTDELSLIIAVPVKDFAGDLVGAVVVAVPPAALSRLLAEIAGKEHRYLPVVADGAGQFLLSLPGVRSESIAPLVGSGRAGALERHLDSDGEPFLVVRTAAAEEAPGWRAAMLVAEREAYGPLRTLRKLLAGLFGVVLVGAVLASAGVLRRAAKPLSDVSASMARV
ncbi:MAG TPA: serine/threonine protein phosphatase, partial [Anaeromyxobacteraceae bacterium]|nr:serine/threonine protein phosphatase [Anaeromyxobacteraceae bacterium]